MHLMFLGAPGSGKGTQAKILEKQFNALQVSTGDILRKAIADQTPLGLKAKEFMAAGKLVPDDLIIELIKSKFSDPDFSNSWIMDGFPRTVPQAEAFDHLLDELGTRLELVIEIKTDNQLLMKRLTGRRVCRECQAPYHVEFNPPRQENICDYCGSADIYQRNDDKEEVVSNRLKVYDEQTAPLIEYYQNKNVLRTVNGSVSVDEVTHSVIEIVKEFDR